MVITAAVHCSKYRRDVLQTHRPASHAKLRRAPAGRRGPGDHAAEESKGTRVPGQSKTTELSYATIKTASYMHCEPVNKAEWSRLHD